MTISRRNFLRTAGTVLGGLTILPSYGFDSKSSNFENKINTYYNDSKPINEVLSYFSNEIFKPIFIKSSEAKDKVIFDLNDKQKVKNIFEKKEDLVLVHNHNLTPEWYELFLSPREKNRIKNIPRPIRMNRLLNWRPSIKDIEQMLITKHQFHSFQPEGSIKFGLIAQKDNIPQFLLFYDLSEEYQNKYLKLIKKTPFIYSPNTLTDKIYLDNRQSRLELFQNKIIHAFSFNVTQGTKYEYCKKMGKKEPSLDKFLDKINNKSKYFSIEIGK